jgi:hypothetical protein
MAGRPERRQYTSVNREDTLNAEDTKTVLYGGMTNGGHINSEIVALKECLARLLNELEVLDRLKAPHAALKVSEACDIVKWDIDYRQGQPPVH